MTSKTTGPQIPHYTIDIWEEISSGCTDPSWVNDLSRMKINSKWMFDLNNEYSLARIYKIDGLGLVLANLEECQYVLRDSQGFWYYVEEDEAALWAFEEKLEVEELAGELRYSVGPHMKAERGEMMNCSDRSMVIPAKRQGRRQAQQSSEESTGTEKSAGSGQEVFDRGRSGTMSTVMTDIEEGTSSVAKAAEI